MLFRNIKLFIRDYFTLTSRERKGAFALVTVIILQIVVMLHLNYTEPKADVYLEPLRIHTYRLQAVLNTPQKSTTKNYGSYRENLLSFEASSFDPNTANDQTWMKKGLSEKQVKIIRNYINKGGRFRTKEDVSKIFGITTEQYNRMKPFIEIREEKKETKTTVDFKTKKEFTIIELNSADTIRLLDLPQVGAGRARMIWKYRERLGGFTNAQQLLEVFTIDTTVFSQLAPHIKIDASLIRKVNLNGDTIRHAYISRQLASAIVAYRRHHGPYRTIEDLRKITLVDEQLYVKLAPYLSIE